MWQASSESIHGWKQNTLFQQAEGQLRLLAAQACHGLSYCLGTLPTGGLHSHSLPGPVLSCGVRSCPLVLPQEITLCCLLSICPLPFHHGELIESRVRSQQPVQGEG